MNNFENLLISEEKFPDRKKFDKVILRNASPFILQTTTKSNIPDIFVGRLDEIKTIIDNIKRIVDNKSCIAIYIEGAGGSGKSTLYAHIYRAIKKKRYDQIDLNNEFKLDSAFIDAPEDVEYFNILYIYNQIMQDLGKSSFFDELAFYTIKRLMEIIEIKYGEENPIKNIRNEVDFVQLNNKRLYNKTIEKIKKHYRMLRIKENFNFDWQFLNKLFDVCNPDFEISMKAVGELDGTYIGGNNYIKNKTDASNTLNLITELIGWIYNDKKVGLVIGIDNIESLMGSKKEEKFINFFNMLLDFRNKVNRTLLVIIGTYTTWYEFISFLQNTDYYNQFLGLFSSNNISLEFLELSQIQQISRKHLELLYGENSLALPVDYPLYPFNSDSIEYLYIMSGRNIRKLKQYLNQLWDEFHEQKRVDFISDAYDIMKRFKDNLILDDYEIDIMYNKLWSSDIKTTGIRSTLVEEGIKRAFESLKTESHWEIYGVENNPQIKISSNSKTKTVRPDVILTLSSQYKIGEIKRVEFQVKIYEESSSVLRSHINTSKKLLEQNKVDFVFFVTTAGFSKSLINELVKDFPERIGGITPLNKEQQAYLGMLVFYKDIFHKDLSPSRATTLLEKSLGIKVGDFFSLIRTLPKITKLEEIPISLDTFESSFSKDVEIIRTNKEQVKELLDTEEMVHTKNTFIEANQEILREQKLVTEKEKGFISRPKEHSSVIEDILLFMYRRKGRYKWQTTYNYLKGKLTSYRDEEVKQGFKCLEQEEKYIEKISSSSIKLNDEGINLLKQFNRI